MSRNNKRQQDDEEAEVVVAFVKVRGGSQAVRDVVSDFKEAVQSATALPPPEVRYLPAPEKNSAVNLHDAESEGRTEEPKVSDEGQGAPSSSSDRGRTTTTNAERGDANSRLQKEYDGSFDVTNEQGKSLSEYCEGRPSESDADFALCVVGYATDELHSEGASDLEVYGAFFHTDGRKLPADVPGVLRGLKKKKLVTRDGGRTVLTTAGRNQLGSIG